MTSPLRIGLLTPAVTGYNAIDSGIGQHFADLALGLSALGHTVVAITPAPQKEMMRDSQFASIRFAPFDVQMPAWLESLTRFRWQLHSVAGARHRAIAATRALEIYIARDKLDFIETTSTGALAVNYVRQRSRIPVVTRVSTTAAQLVSHNAGSSSWPDRDGQRREERLVRASDRLVTHTRSHRDELCRAWSLPAESFTIIPHGIALPPVAALARGVPHEMIDVLYVGRFEHRKGIDVLLNVIPGILHAQPQARFTLVGLDPGDQWQRKFWEANGAIDRARVTFDGVISAERLQQRYRECDVFVAPSRYESFGLIFVEAMGWGKPTVGCRAGGMPEVITEGQSGLLAEPGDEASLCACLLQLIHSAELRRQMGAAARQRATTHFSRETLAAHSAEFYAGVIATMNPAHPSSRGAS
jgi:glycosyltransferase involved in cell wall biosynthesis